MALQLRDQLAERYKPVYSYVRDLIRSNFIAAYLFDCSILQLFLYYMNDYFISKKKVKKNFHLRKFQRVLFTYENYKIINVKLD